MLEGQHGLALPKFQGGYLFLGFLANVVLGAVAALLYASDAKDAFTTGLTANFLLEGVIERVRGRKVASAS